MIGTNGPAQAWAASFLPARSLGGWPRFVCRVRDHGSAAPRFVVFEAWAFLLLASGDFADAQLGFLRFVHQHGAGLVKGVMAKVQKPHPFDFAQGKL